MTKSATESGLGIRVTNDLELEEFFCLSQAKVANIIVLQKTRKTLQGGPKEANAAIIGTEYGNK